MASKRVKWGLTICAISQLTSFIHATPNIVSSSVLSPRLAEENVADTRLLRGTRMLDNGTITTPNCNLIRTEPYPAELQLFYIYSVEINGSLLLNDMERAIENAVAMELDMCDVDGRPVYKVKTGIRHSFSTSTKCDPSHDENTCIVVNGETAILLDRNSDASFVRSRAYFGIVNGLEDSSFLEGFSTSVVSADLISEGHASLLERTDSYGENMNGMNTPYRSSVTATVAVAAASVTIVVGSIFCYGFIRKQPSQDPSVRHRNRSFLKVSPRTIVSGSPSHAPMRRQFVRLEDWTSTPTSLITSTISPQRDKMESPQESISEEGDEENFGINPTINWSISDITTDSASLRSSVSRTPSALERIEEESEDEEVNSESNDNDQDDDSSCNFSYSEDSTTIMDVLSKAGIISQDESRDTLDNSTDRTTESKSDSASKLQQDVSLDACFTIVPVYNGGIFRDFDCTSSEGTEDSPLESLLSDDETIEGSDATTEESDSINLMISPDGFLKMESIDGGNEELSITHSEMKCIFRLSPTFCATNEDNPHDSGLESGILSREEESESSLRHVTNSSRLDTETPELNGAVHIIDDTGSSLHSNSDDDLTLCDDIMIVSSDDHSTSSSSVDQQKILFPFCKKEATMDIDTHDTDSTPEDESMLSISSHILEDDDKMDDIDKSNVVMDDAEAGGIMDIRPVDSVDEWVSELMKE